MEANAIKRIEELVVSGLLKPPDTEIPIALLPGEVSPHSLEQFLAKPVRMRQRFRTERIPDFCNYVKESAKDKESAVFVRPDGGAAVGIIDYGDASNPLWAEHRAELVMQHTPEYKALLDLVGKSHTQRGLTDWLEDWRDIVDPYRFSDDGQGETGSLTVAEAIQGIRRIDLKAIGEKSTEVQDWSARQTTLEQIEARSGSGKLPSGFTFHCKVYPETVGREIDVRLSIRTSQSEPILIARIVGQAALEKVIAEEVELELCSRLQGLRVFIGQV